MTVNKTRVGVFFGVLYAACHLFWAILVLGGWAQGFIDWIMAVHGFKIGYTLETLEYGKAVLGVVMGFAWGFVDGFILGTLWNWIVAKK